MMLFLHMENTDTVKQYVNKLLKQSHNFNSTWSVWTLKIQDSTSEQKDIYQSQGVWRVNLNSCSDGTWKKTINNLMRSYISSNDQLNSTGTFMRVMTIYLEVMKKISQITQISFIIVCIVDMCSNLREFFLFCWTLRLWVIKAMVLPFMKRLTLLIK